MQSPIDINCDMGESSAELIIGQDEQIMPLVSSSNIACGLHGGDEVVLKKTIRLAIKHGVKIGAHPSYPDREGFGRRKMDIKPSELKRILVNQIEKVMTMAASFGSTLIYVKPHGALYNSMSNNLEEAQAMLDALSTFSQPLALMGKAGSSLESFCEGKLTFIPEAFIDRVYEDDGSLRSRKEEDAVIQDPDKAVQQLLDMTLKKCVLSKNGSVLPIKAKSFCIHGDNPAALSILLEVHRVFKEKQLDLNKGLWR